jgi:hypothetical protein
MITLINVELYKIFKKWRTYIGFFAITVLVSIVQTAIYFEGDDYMKMMTRGLGQSFIFTGNLLNGFLIAHLILGVLFVHVPFLITLVAGDLLAGEATNGTYRLLITRPVSRFQLVTSKFIAGLIYSFLLVAWLAVFSLLLGVILFGTGELLVIKDSIIIFAQNDIMWRFFAAYGMAVLSMWLVTALAFLFSSLVENSIGPIITTMTVIIIFLIVSTIKISVFEDIGPYLFTSYMKAWSYFFDDPIEFDKVIKAGIIMFAHVAGLYGLTLYIFRKKDILS